MSTRLDYAIPVNLKMQDEYVYHYAKEHNQYACNCNTTLMSKNEINNIVTVYFTNFF